MKLENLDRVNEIAHEIKELQVLIDNLSRCNQFILKHATWSHDSDLIIEQYIAEWQSANDFTNAFLDEINKKLDTLQAEMETL